MKDLILDLRDFFMYDLLKKPLPKVRNLSLDLKFRLHKEKKGLWVESQDYPGLIASGKNEEELREAIFDSILTYFDVPRETATRLPDTLILNLPNGKKILPKTTPCFQVTLATA